MRYRALGDLSIGIRWPPLTRSNTFMGRYIRYSNMGFSRQITFPIQVLAEFGQAQPEPPDAAARRALWPVAGSSTGGDAAAAARPLPLLPPLPQPALDVDEAVQQQPVEHEVELEPRRPRTSASAALPTLAVVLYEQGRYVTDTTVSDHTSPVPDPRRRRSSFGLPEWKLTGTTRRGLA